MIEITPAAAEQIKLSMEEGENENLALRIAATLNDDSSVHYGMGFDETKEGDTKITSSGIDIIISPVSAEILKDTKLDYVELEPGKHQFIFLIRLRHEYNHVSRIIEARKSR